MSCVTLSSTCRRSYNSNVSVSDCSGFATSVVTSGIASVIPSVTLCSNSAIRVGITTNGTSMSSVTLGSTCRRSYNGVVFMSKSFAFGCITYGTSLRSGAGCSSPSVSKSFAFGCITYGTSLGSSAGCSSPSVSKSSYFFVSRIIASGTGYVCIPALFGTGRSLSLVSDLVVAESINGDSLTADLFVTNCTVNYIIIRTCHSTCGSLVVFSKSRIGLVTESGYDFFYTADLLTTFGTVNYEIVASCFGTRGFYVIFLNGITCCVTGSGDFFCIRMTAIFTGIDCISNFCASRIYILRAVAMSKRINVIICVRVVTVRTGIGCITLCSAGGRSYNRSVIVTGSGNNLSVAIATSTSTSLKTCNVTRSGSGYYLFVNVVVNINYFLCYDNCLTNRAVRTCVKTCILTSRTYNRINYLGVTGSRNNLGVAITTGTGVSSFTLGGTFRSRGDCYGIVVSMRLTTTTSRGGGKYHIIESHSITLSDSVTSGFNASGVNEI